MTLTSHVALISSVVVFVSVGAQHAAPLRAPSPPVGQVATADARGKRAQPEEVRALWVVLTTLTSPEAIRTMVTTARESGFNTLIVQVRGRGDAYYSSRWEPRAEPLKTQPRDFDPLALTIAEARKVGLRVHAWLNTHLLANLQELPADPSHVFHKHPEWLMVPRPIAAALSTVNPADPTYRARIVEWSKGDLVELEGVYTSPAHPAVQEHLYNVWMDVVDRYEIDGIHFDYVRFPSPAFDYSRTALERFRVEVEKEMSVEERRAFGRLAVADPLIYPTVYPARWDSFRRDQITALVERIAYGVRQRKPALTISAAVFADDQDAYGRRFQDWKLWLERGLLDVVCPMAYTPDTEIFKRQIAIARGFSFGQRVWAGIGAYRQPVEGTVEKIDVARRIGADGIILFSYDSLIKASETNPAADYLARVKRLAFERK